MSDSFLDELSKVAKSRRRSLKKDNSLKTPMISIENDPAFRKMRLEKEELEKERTAANAVSESLKTEKEALELKLRIASTNSKAPADRTGDLSALNTQIEKLTMENQKLKAEALGLRKTKVIDKSLRNGVTDAEEVLSIFPSKLQSVIENYFKMSKHYNPRIKEYYHQLFYSIVKANEDENGYSFVSTRELVGLGIPSGKISQVRTNLVQDGFIEVEMVEKDKRVVPRMRAV